MTRFGQVLAVMVAVLLIGLLLHPANRVEAVDEGYCVFEKIDAHSPVSHVISRTDWLSVALCAQAAMMAPRSLRAPENPSSSQMTAVEAAALMDGMRLSFGAPGPSDRFHQRCDRSHTVWKKAGTDPPVRAFTHIDLGTETAGIGYIPEKTGLCCEDAAMMVSPTPGRDCRAFNLASAAGTVARTPAGWVVLAGGPVSITPPGKTPIVIPSLDSSATDPSGEYVCRLSTSTPPSDDCHANWKAAAGKDLPATVSHAWGTNYRIAIRHGSDVLPLGVPLLQDGSVNQPHPFGGPALVGQYKNGEWKLSYYQRNCIWTVVCTRKK